MNKTKLQRPTGSSNITKKQKHKKPLTRALSTAKKGLKSSHLTKHSTAQSTSQHFLHTQTPTAQFNAQSRLKMKNKRFFSSSNSLEPYPFDDDNNAVTTYTNNNSNLSTGYTQPLSTQLGNDTYNFRSVPTLSSHFQADPTKQRHNITTEQGQFDASKVPEDADAHDIIAILREEQRAELEAKLDGVHDEHQRSFIIYQSALTFQQRLNKMRSFRKEQKRAVIDQVQTALDNMKANSSALSVLDLVSLLRGVSVGDPHLQVYSVNHVSTLHDYMMFFSCRDQSHLSLVANSVVDFVSTHSKFNKRDGDKKDKNQDDKNTQDSTTGSNGMSLVNSSSKRAKALQGTSNDKNNGDDNNGSTDESTDPKYTGRKFGELLVFSRHDLPWRIIDLGSVLLHLSYGPERKLSDMESVLAGYNISLDQKTNQGVLAKTRLHKCLEITPISMLEDESSSLSSNNSAKSNDANKPTNNGVKH